MLRRNLLSQKENCFINIYIFIGIGKENCYTKMKDKSPMEGRFL